MVSLSISIDNSVATSFYLRRLLVSQLRKYHTKEFRRSNVQSFNEFQLSSTPSQGLCAPSTPSYAPSTPSQGLCAPSTPSYAPPLMRVVRDFPFLFRQSTQMNRDLRMSQASCEPRDTT
ncbi:hypothetical protein M8J75_014104 [Diaphorina citri]|nr:hypothetical protein M8J75_014104 [Diaphorina citri]